MSTSKLKSFEPVMKDGVHASYTTSHGTFYNFIVEMENADKGQASSKYDTPKWKVGEEYEYTLEVKGNYTNIKGLKSTSFNKGGFGGGSKYDSTGARVGMSINCAVSLVAHGKVEMKDLERIADRICIIAETLEEKHKK